MYCLQHILPGHGSSRGGGGGASDSENCDDSSSFHGRLSPRVSLALLADDEVMMIPKRKSSKFYNGILSSFYVTIWRRQSEIWRRHSGGANLKSGSANQAAPI